MIRRPPRSTQSRSSAASDVYKRQDLDGAPLLDVVLPRRDPSHRLGDVLPLGLGKEADMAEVEAEQRDRRATGDLRCPQDRAVAAEHHGHRQLVEVHPVGLGAGLHPGIPEREYHFLRSADGLGPPAVSDHQHRAHRMLLTVAAPTRVATSSRTASRTASCTLCAAASPSPVPSTGDAEPDVSHRTVSRLPAGPGSPLGTTARTTAPRSLAASATRRTAS